MPIPSIRRVAVATSVAALLTVPSVAVAAPADPVAPVAAPAAPRAVYPPLPGSLVLSSTLLVAGGVVSFVVSGFLAFELVTAELIPSGSAEQAEQAGNGAKSTRQVLGTFKADAQEVVRGTVRIPCDTAPGSYLFSLTGQTSGATISVPVTVVRRSHHHEGPGSSGSTGCKAKKEEAIVAKSLDAWPTAHQDAPPESGAGDRQVLVGVVAALAALGGSRLVLRHRRSSARRG